MHHLGLCALPMLGCSSFLTYTPNWPVALFCCCSIHLELSTCWHSTVQKHSHFQMPLENPCIQTHLVLLCCIKRLCIFWPKGAIQIRYYYYYYTRRRRRRLAVLFLLHIIIIKNIWTKNYGTIELSCIWLCLMPLTTMKWRHRWFIVTVATNREAVRLKLT